MNKSFSNTTRYLFWYPYGLGDIVMLVPLIKKIENQNGSLKNHIFIFKDQTSLNLALFFFPSINAAIFNGNFISLNFLILIKKILRCSVIISPMLSRRYFSYLFLFLFCKKLLVPNNFFNNSLLWMKVAPSNLLTFSGHQASFLIDFYSLADKSFNPSGANPCDINIKNKEKSISRAKMLNIGVGLSCGHLEKHKIPSPEFFSSYFNELSTNINFKISIFGTFFDKPIIESFMKDLNKNIQTEEFLNLDFQDLFNEISCCDFGVSGTTGQGHMFAVSNIKLITFTGVTDEFKNGPLSDKQLYINHNFECGPCYSDNYKYGCARIKCMDLISIDYAVSKSLKFIKGEESGYIENIQQLS